MRIQKRSIFCDTKCQLGVVVAVFGGFLLCMGGFPTKSLFVLRLISVRGAKGVPPHYIFCGFGKISFFVINNIENHNNNNKAFFIPALLTARRDNNFVLKHATDARRRKFSNDDGYVERARE